MARADFVDVACFVLLIVACTIASQVVLFEGFGPGHIYLVGDSVLANEKYVGPGDSVYAQLHRKYQDSTLLAEDGARASDVTRQLAGLTNGKCTAVISAGGNDILQTPTHDQEAAFGQLDQVFTGYEKAVNDFSRRGGSEVYLLDVYYPPASSLRPYYPLIEHWNTKQAVLAKEKGYKLIRISNVMRNERDFVEEYEPSKLGAGKIVTAILEPA